MIKLSILIKVSINFCLVIRVIINIKRLIRHKCFLFQYFWPVIVTLEKLVAFQSFSLIINLEVVLNIIFSLFYYFFSFNYCEIFTQFDPHVMRNLIMLQLDFIKIFVYIDFKFIWWAFTLYHEFKYLGVNCAFPMLVNFMTPLF